MKEINDKNLDAWLFEYFEGDLSEAESEHLLREVGNNKDFIEEFNYWKQSYLKEYPSIQYSYSDKLKKKPLWKTYWPSLPAIGLAIFLMGYYGFDYSKNEDNKSTTTKNTINSTISKGNSILVNSVSNESQVGKENVIAKTNSNASKTKLKIQESQPAIEVSNSSNEVTIVKDTSITTENNITISKETNVASNENIISKKISETAPKQTIKAEEKENKKVKSKPIRLKNIHLKPAEEINKMNSDF